MASLIIMLLFTMYMSYDSKGKACSNQSHSLQTLIFMSNKVVVSSLFLAASGRQCFILNGYHGPLGRVSLILC